MDSVQKPLWQATERDVDAPHLESRAILHDVGDRLLLLVEYAGEGADIKLDLDGIAKLREALDVWYFNHA